MFFSPCLCSVSSHIRARLPQALWPACCLSSMLGVRLQSSEKCHLLQSTLGFILFSLRVCARAGRGCQESTLRQGECCHGKIVLEKYS